MTSSIRPLIESETTMSASRVERVGSQDEARKFTRGPCNGDSPPARRLLDPLGLVDEVADLLGQPIVALARLMRGNLQGDGTKEVVIPFRMAPQ